MKSHIENIRDLEIRNDDIYLATYPKCGNFNILIIVQFTINASIAESSFFGNFSKYCFTCNVSKAVVNFQSNGVRVLRVIY